jgi:hypothetical protein
MGKSARPVRRGERRVVRYLSNSTAAHERLVCCELRLQILKEVLEYDLVVATEVF